MIISNWKNLITIDFFIWTKLIQKILFFSGIILEDESSQITEEHFRNNLGITETETKTTEETNSSSTFAVGAPESDIYGLEITTITGLNFVLFSVLTPSDCES